MKARGTGFLLVLICATFLLFAPTPAVSQAVYGSIFGTFTDPQGAAVPGVKVTVTAIGKGTTETATTNESGNYTVTHLIPGSYQVRGEKEGFKAFFAESVDVRADVATRVDGQLQVGAVAETVTVTAESVPLLKTDRADVATTFSEKVVLELPIFERNFTQFQLLTPGTQKLQWQHASSENPQGSIQIMVNGQHFSGTSFQLDGTDNRDPILGIIVINPTLESVTETKITTQNYDAEFGQALAAVVTAQTRSGSNDFHGSAFWFRRTDWGQARNPFTQPSIRPLPSTKWNQFGASFGGPISKNKLFFFGDYQGTRRTTGRSVRLNVPTALVRSTCLAGLPCNLSEYLQPGGINQVYDPATGNPATGTGRTAFAGNIIPAARISPQAVALLRQLPVPNVTGAGITQNFIGSGSGSLNDDDFNTRVDYNASERLKIFGRYSFADFIQSGPTAFGDVVGGPGFGVDGFGGQAPVRNQSIAAGFDYSLGPTWLTDFRFGFFRYRVQVVPNGIGTSPATDAGIPGLNVDNFFSSGMPEFNIEGAGGTDFRFGYALGTNRCNCPLDQKEQQWQFVNNWTNIRGNHNIKWGADIRYARNLRVPSDKHRAGQLNFNTRRTGNPDGGLALATFLLGDVTFFERYVSPFTDAGETQKRWFFYGQDMWRVTPKITLNYGLRWEIYFPQKVTRNGGGGWLDVNTGNIRVGGVGGIDLTGNTENSFTNFAPRIGIAYQVRPKTIVRMGYGRSFDIGVFGSIFGHSVTQNLPVLASQEERGAQSWLAGFTLAAGPPPPTFVPVPPSGLFPQPDGVASFVQPLKMRMPTIDAWNLTVQHQITPTMSAEVGYVGNKGTHVFAGDGPDYNCNQPRIEGFPGSQNARKPFFPRFGWTQNLRCHNNDASNNYHALQAKFEKRLSQGFQFLAHYTWAKGLNHDGDYYVINPKVNYGPNSFDRAHVFVLTNLWELPFGRGKRFLSDASGVLDRIVGGWEFNSTWTAYGGLPFSPSYASGGADRDTGPGRPNRVGDVQITGDRNRWFTTATSTLTNPAFNPITNPCPSTAGITSGPWQRPACATFGTASRNSLRGPGLFQTDLALFKNSKITERVNLQFRTEIFNVFNKVNLGQPADCVDCGNAGQINNTAFFGNALQRQFQFGLKLQF